MCMEDVNIDRALKSRAWSCAQGQTTVIPANNDRVAIRTVPQGNSTYSIFVRTPDNSAAGINLNHVIDASYADQDVAGEQILRNEPHTITLADVGEFLKYELNVVAVEATCFLTEVYLPVNAGPSPDVSKLPK